MILRAIVMAMAFVFLATPAMAEEGKRRNVLLIIGDDHGLDLGCYGNAAIKTPNLDALAADGTRFTHGFATVASCSPSRAVLMSGLYTHSNGQYGLAHAAHNQRSLPTVRSLPAVLNAQNYRTVLIGKGHFAPQEVYPFQAEPKVPQGYRNVAVMADMARAVFAADDPKPFFMLVGFGDPHRAPKGFGNEAAYKGGVEKIAYDPAAVRIPYHLPDQPEVRGELAEFYESISRLDQGVGMLMKALRESNRLDDTLVIYLSDNGIPFPGAKTTLYDAGIRLPLIVRSPEQKKRGVVSDAMASWIDIAPTIYQWAGVKTPPPLPGRSILPILETETTPGWDTIFGSHIFHEVTMYYPMRAIRTRTHKLIWNLAHELTYPHASDLWGSPTWQGIRKRNDAMMGMRPVQAFLHRPEFELYDLQKDPNEVQNIAADPATAAILKELRGKLEAMLVETKDPWMEPELRERNP